MMVRLVVGTTGTRPQWLMVGLAGLVLAACSAGGGSGPTADAGSGGDARSAEDAGTRNDASQSDGGSAPDSAVSFDAAAPDAAAPDAASNDGGADAGDGGVDPCDFTPCGGDLLGTWDIGSVCFTGVIAVLRASCPDVVIESQPGASGQFVFSDDMSFSFVASLSGDFSYTLPSQCIADGVTSCEELATGGQTCTGDPATSCTCTENSDDSTDQSGTYETSGTTLTVTPSSGGSQDAEYCVNGSTLWFEGGGVLFRAKTP